jgi:uncharacterized protein (TIGR00251 family)
MSSSAEGRCWSAVAGGLRLRLKVQPKARRNAILGPADGPDGPALKVAVGAPPEDGKANAAVVALLAEALDVAKAAVSVVIGATDRRKLVEIRGNSSALGARLDRLIEDLERNGHE